MLLELKRLGRLLMLNSIWMTVGVSCGSNFVSETIHSYIAFLLGMSLHYFQFSLPLLSLDAYTVQSHN